ncbi:MAG: HDIG domain-containing protein [Candidatus Pacebacteria bacterium]|nr:HDIG domain-containing protein [Candidatus Paceibacterota bacterium]
MTEMPIPDEILLPIEPLCILHTLMGAGFEVALVGGAVRDVLRGETQITDFDCTTNATPEQITALFPESFYENNFGTVSITPEELAKQLGLNEQIVQTPTATTDRVIDVARATKLHPSLLDAIAKEEIKEHHLPPYEITTYRADGLYSDNRRPESVTWGNSLEEDLARRDFTINALALTFQADFLARVCTDTSTRVIRLKSQDYKLIDPWQGLADLEEQRIRTVGDPNKRFAEDALRLLRAVRFSVQLNFAIEDETLQAITRASELLQNISQERIREELFKIFLSPYAKEGIELLAATGLLSHILPEILAMNGVLQGGHHTTDVWTHSLDALAECPSRDPVVKLAVLLHDIGKPQTFDISTGSPTFYNHEVVGARTAKAIAQRLKLSKKDIDRMFILVRYHMFHYQPEMSDAAVRRFMRKVGLANIDDILDVREGDRLGSGARKTSWRLEEFKQRMIAELHQPFAITDLAIDGSDLMRELDLQPGPKIGHLLQTLFEVVLENPEKNEKTVLLGLARELLPSLPIVPQTK